MRFRSSLLLVASLCASIVSVAPAQSLPQLTRIAPTTGLADSSLYLCTDSTKTLTRACKFSDVQKRLAFKSFDSLATTRLTLTGATITGAPTWSSLQTFAVGQRVDSATGAARASALVGSPAITVSSCTGCGGGLPAANGSAAAPSIAFTNSTGSGFYRFGADTIGVTTGGVASLGIRGGASPTIFGGAGSMTIQAGTGNSRTMTLQSTTSAGAAKNTLVLGADSSVTALGQFKAISGTVAAPSYAFTAQANDGLFRQAAGSLGWVANGIETFRLDGGGGNLIGLTTSFSIVAGFANSSRLKLQTTNSSGTQVTFIRGNELAQSLFADGAVGAPGIGFAADSLLGLYRVGTAGASDTVMITANGVNQMKIGAAGVLRLPLLPAEGSTKNAMCWDGTTFNVTQNAAATCTVSSARFKENIVPLTVADAWRIVGKSQLHTSTYNERVGGRKAIGIIAEQADSADTRLASRDARGLITSTNYEEVTSLLLTIVKDQRRQLDSLMIIFGAARDSTNGYYRRSGQWRRIVNGRDAGVITNIQADSIRRVARKP